MSLPGSPPRWAPTHVQVTVLRARGLRPKAKGAGGSDAYALMALGKEKFATAVAERCLGAPVWREEATFELPPRRPGHGAEPALQLTVLHRALLGLDKFLGRAEISLAALQEEGGRRATRWYTLHSKPGKKEKERGEIEVDIQFMRSNMTASMFDLSMKDKSRSPFGKLKGKLKGKRANGLPDTASAIIPSITHSPADSEEESFEKEKKKKSKIKTLFSKPGLQKTSLSQSMSVLPAFQPVTEKVRLKPGDFQSKWGDDEDESLSTNSEKAFGNQAEDNSLHAPGVMAHKRTASADNKQLNQITSSNAKKEGLSLFSGLKSKNDPTSRSNVCINGNHVYMKEGETKRETMSKDNTPSSSPQTFRKNQFSESDENLSSKSTMEHEKTGRMSPSRGLPGSPSLETFKTMTLPSYKLLSSGDLLENSAPLSLETAKEETKEDKKQENKKSALLSLVTGRKEIVKNYVENMSDMTSKESKAKLFEEKKKEEKAKPAEVPMDLNQESISGNSNRADVPRNKKSHNPFDEELMQEQKPEKSAASARTIQTKAVKPRLGVSSEDETTATFPTSVPDSLPAFLSAHHSNNDNNPSTSKVGQKFKAPDSENSGSPFPPSLISAQGSNDSNPFISDWEQQFKAQGSESFKSPLLYFSHPPTALADVSPLVLSSHLSNDSNPFVSKLGEEPKVQGLKSFNSPPPSFSLPSAISSKSYCSSAINLADSEHSAFVHSEESQSESLTNDASSLRSLSESPPLPVCERVEQTLKKQCDAKEVQIVSPITKNNRVTKQSVTFRLNELENADSGSKAAEALDREQPAKCHPDQCEEMFTIDPTITEKRREFASVLDVECYPSSKLCEERMNSVPNNESAGQDDIETSSTNGEIWMKDSQELTPLSKSNYSLSHGNGVAQPSSAESKFSEEQEICSGKKMKHSLKMGESGLTLESKVTNAIKSNSSVQVEPPRPTPRVRTLLSKDANKSEDVAELRPLFAKLKPTPRNAVKLSKCAPVSLTGRLKDEGMLTPLDGTENPLNPHENPTSDSLLKTAALSTTRHLDIGNDNNGHIKHKADGHDVSLFNSGTDLKSAVPVTRDHSLTHVGLPVILEVGSDDELLDDYRKKDKITAIYKSVPSTESQCTDSLSFTEELKLSSDMNSTNRASILLQEREGSPEDELLDLKASSKLNSVIDMFSASSKASESSLDMLSYPSEHGCGVEEQELKESRKNDFFEPSKKSVSFTSLSSSSQLSSSSSSLQSGTYNSSRTESMKKPTAESFDEKVRNAGEKKLLKAWVSPSETLPNQTQQSDETVSVKHRPHPVKPMNTTTNKSHAKNLSTITKMDEKWTESNRKKYDPSDPAYAYTQLTHDELIQLVLRQKDTITKRELQVRELEDYIDNLLVRVMEETPNILRTQSQISKAGRI